MAGDDPRAEGAVETSQPILARGLPGRPVSSIQFSGQPTWRTLLSSPILYLLYEHDRASVEPVSVLTIDRGMLPDRAVLEVHPLPDRSQLEDKVDVRRVRALLVAALERGAEQGHTLMPRGWLTTSDRQYATRNRLPCWTRSARWAQGAAHWGRRAGRHGGRKLRIPAQTFRGHRRAHSSHRTETPGTQDPAPQGKPRLSLCSGPLARGSPRRPQPRRRSKRGLVSRKLQRSRKSWRRDSLYSSEPQGPARPRS